MPFKEGVEPLSVLAYPRVFLTYTQLQHLREDFMVLKMTFPVRCKHPVCAVDTGPLVEIFQNNILVPGKFRQSINPLCFIPFFARRNAPKDGMRGVWTEVHLLLSRKAVQ